MVKPIVKECPFCGGEIIMTKDEVYFDGPDRHVRLVTIRCVRCHATFELKGRVTESWLNIWNRRCNICMKEHFVAQINSQQKDISMLKQMLNLRDDVWNQIRLEKSVTLMSTKKVEDMMLKIKELEAENLAFRKATKKLAEARRSRKI